MAKKASAVNVDARALWLQFGQFCLGEIIIGLPLNRRTLHSSVIFRWCPLKPMQKGCGTSKGNTNNWKRALSIGIALYSELAHYEDSFIQVAES